MYTKISNAYGWESPEIIHNYSVIWHSKLNFILKKIEFLKDLLKNNIFSIVETHLTRKGEKYMEELKEMKSEVSSLLNKVTLHKNGVKILFVRQFPYDSVWDYKHEHRKLMIKMHEFDSKYQLIKKEIFGMVKEAIKHFKQKRIS